MISCYALLLLALSAFAHSLVLEHVPRERELRRELFKDYDIYARPVIQHSTSVPVNVSLSILRIKELDELNEELSLASWVKLTWKDEYLTWNPADYDDIDVLRVSPSQVWKPDISVYTASEDTAFFPVVQTNVLLYNTGTVLWVPPFSLKIRCPIPLQRNNTSSTKVECNIRFGSWTHSIKTIDLQLDPSKADLTYFQDSNRDWKLVKVDSARDSKLYPCCPEEYPYVDFNVTLKSRN